MSTLNSYNISSDNLVKSALALTSYFGFSGFLCIVKGKKGPSFSTEHSF